MADETRELTAKQLASGFGGKSLIEGGRAAIAIESLAEELQAQNKIAQDEKSDMETNQRLDQLIKTTKISDKAGFESAVQLRTQFQESQERLAKAIESGDENAINLEKVNQEEILQGTESEENRREAQKTIDKQSKLLGKIAGGIGNLATKAKDNAGFLAGLGLLALSVLDPEKLKQIIKKVVEVISNTIKMVEQLINGDFEGAFATFRENWLAFTGAFVFFFGSKIIAIFSGITKAFTKLKQAAQLYRAFLVKEHAGSMIEHFKSMKTNLGNKIMRPIRAIGRAATAFKAMMIGTYIPFMVQHFKDMMSALGGKLMKLVRGIGTAARVFRAFMMVTALPAIAGLFTGMIAAMTPVIAAVGAALVAAAPFIAVAAGIGLVLFGLKKAFDSVLTTFRETGSIFEAFKAGVITFPATILGLPLDLLKKGISWIMGMFGFDNAKAVLDSFSFQDLFKNLFGKVFDTMTSAFGYLIDKFKVFGNFVKAIGLGAVAAVMAAFPGGESPVEAFKRVYNETLSSGSGDTGKAESPDFGSSDSNFNLEQQNPLSLTTDEISDLQVFSGGVDQSRDLLLEKEDAIRDERFDGNRFDTVKSRNTLSKSLGGKANLVKLSEEDEGLESLVARKLLQFEDQLLKSKPVDFLQKAQEKLLGGNVEKVSREFELLKQELDAKKEKAIQVINNVQNNQGNTTTNSTAIQSSGRRRGYGLSNVDAFS